jgi:hypothetical protein
MPQAKTTKNKSTGRTSGSKVGGGGVGTRVSKFNLKIVIPIVVVVAALGGFYIFRKSGASGNYTFVRNAHQMTGGNVQKKLDGVTYMFLESGKISTMTTGLEIGSSNQICAHVKALKDTNVTIYSLEQPYYSARNAGLREHPVKNGNTANVCGPVHRDSLGRNPTGGLIEVRSSVNSALLVDTIYGKP